MQNNAVLKVIDFGMIMESTYATFCVCIIASYILSCTFPRCGGPIFAVSRGAFV